MEFEPFLYAYREYLGLALLVAMMAGFLIEKVPPAVTAAIAAAFCIAAGYLDKEEALAAFSNSAPVTIAALFVLSGALVRTGLLSYVAGATVKLAEERPITALALLFQADGKGVDVIQGVFGQVDGVQPECRMQVLVCGTEIDQVVPGGTPYRRNEQVCYAGCASGGKHLLAVVVEFLDVQVAMGIE